MENKRERAHDIAEEGLDKLIESDTEAGEKLIGQAKKIDPKGLRNWRKKRDKENADRFVDKGWAGSTIGRRATECAHRDVPDRCARAAPDPKMALA
jgi:hypothetical protein